MKSKTPGKTELNEGLFFIGKLNLKKKINICLFHLKEVEYQKEKFEMNTLRFYKFYEQSKFINKNIARRMAPKRLYGFPNDS